MAWIQAHSASYRQNVGAVAVPHDVSQGKRKEGIIRAELQVELAEALLMKRSVLHWVRSQPH